MSEVLNFFNEKKKSMSKFSKEALKLLLKYGIGCVPEERREEVEHAIKTSNFAEDSVKGLLPTAYLALSNRKTEEKDVRRYFFQTHNILAEKMNKKECCVFVAKVLKSYGSECEVVYEGKVERVKCLDRFKDGDFIVVHAGYAVEKYDKNLHTW